MFTIEWIWEHMKPSVCIKMKNVLPSVFITRFERHILTVLKLEFTKKLKAENIPCFLNLFFVMNIIEMFWACENLDTCLLLFELVPTV